MSEAPATSKVRWLWLPIFPLLCVAFFVYRTTTAGFTLWRIVGLAVNSVWLVLSLYDWRTKGQFRRWLYSDDD